MKNSYIDIIKNREWNIMIVDDDVLHVMLLKAYIKQFLCEEKITFYCAMDGVHCLDIFNKNDIDLIILDSCMPKMCGKEVVQYFIDREIKIPPILYSSKDISIPEIKWVSKCYKNPMLFDYIHKPIKLELLEEKVEQILYNIYFEHHPELNPPFVPEDTNE